MEAYIGGNVKSLSGRILLEKIDKVVRGLGIDTFLPHRDALIQGKIGKEKGLLTFKEYYDIPIRQSIFEQDIKPLDNCDIAIMVLDGLCWGTTMELGYVYAIKRRLNKQLTIIGFFSDPRGYQMLDIMRYEACDFLVSTIEELESALIRLIKAKKTLKVKNVEV